MDTLPLYSPLSFVKLYPGSCTRHKFNQETKCEVKGGGGLFLGYKNLICFCYSRDGIPSPSPVHTPLPKSTFQFARLAPLLYLWHVPETSDGTALEKHQCYPHFSPPLLRPTPRLPNLIKLINSFPLHQYYSISFSFFCHPRPHL